MEPQEKVLLWAMVVFLIAVVVTLTVFMWDAMSQ